MAMSGAEARSNGKVKMWTNRHKAYCPLQPCSNKLLKLKWDQRAREIHQQKLKEVKSTIDNRAPKTYMHLHLKLKKLQIEEERLTTIERNNRILLEKMSHIMRQANTIDNRNTYMHKSLNKTQRQRELLRITHENQAILKRIQSKQPHYSHMQWEDERNVNEGYLRNISSYNFDVCAENELDTEQTSPFSASVPSHPPRTKPNAAAKATWKNDPIDEEASSTANTAPPREQQKPTQDQTTTQQNGSSSTGTAAPSAKEEKVTSTNADIVETPPSVSTGENPNEAVQKDEQQESGTQQEADLEQQATDNKQDGEEAKTADADVDNVAPAAVDEPAPEEAEEDQNANDTNQDTSASPQAQDSEASAVAEEQQQQQQQEEAAAPAADPVDTAPAKDGEEISDANVNVDDGNQDASEAVDQDQSAEIADDTSKADATSEDPQDTTATSVADEMPEQLELAADTAADNQDDDN